MVGGVLQVRDEVVMCFEARDEAAVCYRVGIEADMQWQCGGVQGDRRASAWRFQKIAKCYERERGA
jgi:hypothetical protein